MNFRVQVVAWSGGEGGRYYTPESILHDYLILMTPGVASVVTRWPLAVAQDLARTCLPSAMRPP